LLYGAISRRRKIELYPYPTLFRSAQGPFAHFADLGPGRQPNFQGDRLDHAGDLREGEHVIDVRVPSDDLRRRERGPETEVPQGTQLVGRSHRLVVTHGAGQLADLVQLGEGRQATLGPDQVVRERGQPPPPRGDLCRLAVRPADPYGVLVQYGLIANAVGQLLQAGPDDVSRRLEAQAVRGVDDVRAGQALVGPRQHVVPVPHTRAPQVQEGDHVVTRLGLLLLHSRGRRYRGPVHDVDDVLRGTEGLCGLDLDLSPLPELPVAGPHLRHDGGGVAFQLVTVHWFSSWFHVKRTPSPRTRPGPGRTPVRPRRGKRR